MNISSIQGDRLDLLKTIHRNHLQRIPFENFDMHMYGKLDLALDKLYEKIVIRRRGGICYELNYLLYNLLKELGYDVILLSGSVLDEGDSEFDHLFLLVTLESVRYLVDVGFGDNFFEPILFDCHAVQQDVKGYFRIKKVSDDTYRLEHKTDNEYVCAYTFRLVTRYVKEFEERMNWFCHSEGSIFAKRLFCSIENPKGRISIRPGRITITANGNKEEFDIRDFVEFKHLLADKFKLEFLDEDPLLQEIYNKQG